MKELLTRCNGNLNSLPCCHSEQSNCNCYPCLHSDFRTRPDTYNCEKKMNYYVLNYGPSFASEIYHYLSFSKILEGFSFTGNIRILSLGCGFAPDLLAISRYIDDNHLPVQFEYYGVDQSSCWDTARYYSGYAKFIQGDAITTMNFSDYDLVFISKLFSTLYKHDSHEKFLAAFSNAVGTQLNTDCIVVFHDINSRHMGRDVLHNSVQNLFNSYRQFYCDNPPYTNSNWERIPPTNIVFSIPNGLNFDPLRVVGKTVFFEYRK